jgi:two-component system, cell cycle sensor histidine kinase and response regulator CckA
LLLVDDEAAILDMMAEYLSGEPQKFRILIAHGGFEALAMLATNYVDVLVTDLMMPGMLGTELIENARRLNPAIQMVLISAEVPPPVTWTFLPKPFRMAELATTIVGLLPKEKAGDTEPPAILV